MKCKCSKIKKEDFDEINWIVIRGTLLTCLVHTNYIYFQLGAFISQEGKTIDFYGRKLIDDQKSYTVTLKELFSIVETLK